MNGNESDNIKAKKNSNRLEFVQAFLDSGGITALSTPEFFEKMISLRMGSSLPITDLIREAAKNEKIMSWIKASSAAWVRGVTKVIKEHQREGVINSDIHPASLV